MRVGIVFIVSSFLFITSASGFENKKKDVVRKSREESNHNEKVKFQKKNVELKKEKNKKRRLFKAEKKRSLETKLKKEEIQDKGEGQIKVKF